MSRQERYDTRDRVFSHWHRTLPDCVPAIDIDFLEYCRKCRWPLALIELAQDVGQSFKPTPVLQRLARQANVPAYLIFYTVEGDSVSAARVQELVPKRGRSVPMTGIELGEWLTKLHTDPCYNCEASADTQTSPYVLPIA